MNSFKTIAFTHKTADLKDIGRLHLEDDALAERLPALRQAMGLDELLYLSTCNRVELMLSTSSSPDRDFLTQFFTALRPDWLEADIAWAADHAQVLEGEAALQHLYYVTSSMDSLVVGEREIITQVRQAYERCRELGVAGDRLRLAVRSAIGAAKRVYTETQIAQRPVSVVSLAHREMMEHWPVHPPQVLMIGAGQTNRLMARYLRKAPMADITVYNRTPERAKELAEELGGQGLPLDALPRHASAPDIIITCTGAAQPVLPLHVFRALRGDSRSPITVVDLALPSDIEQAITDEPGVRHIGIGNLRERARKNLEERQRELERCKRIISESMAELGGVMRERDVELAMGRVPGAVKEIRERAMNEVFAKELAVLDPQAREVLERVIGYMEKKYISIPMRMAKEVMLDKR